MAEDLPALYGLFHEQAVQLRVLSDLCKYIVRAHLAFREHHSQLCKQFTDLRWCLESKGLVSEEDVPRPPDLPDPPKQRGMWPGGAWACHSCMSLLYPEESECSACGRCRPPWPWRRAAPERASLAWLDVPDVVQLVGVAAGTCAMGQLMATARLGLRAVCQAGPPLRTFVQRPQGEERAGKPGPQEEVDCLTLLQDVWQYSPLAEALTCAMDAGSVRHFRATSRAGDESLRVTTSLAALQKPPRPKPEQQLRAASDSTAENGADSAGRVTLALLHDLWQYHTLADCLTSAMGVSSVRQFSAVSRGCRECSREWKCQGLGGGGDSFLCTARTRGSFRRARARAEPPAKENSAQVRLPSSSRSSSSSRATLQEAAAEAPSTSVPASGCSAFHAGGAAMVLVQAAEAAEASLPRRPAEEAGRSSGSAAGRERLGPDPGAGADLASMLESGAAVKLKGLKRRLELNGMTGRLVGSAAGGERWLVALENGESLRVRTSNLQVLEPHSGMRPHEVENNAALLQSITEGSAGTLRGRLPPAKLEEEIIRKGTVRLYLVGGCSGSDMVRACDLFDARPGGVELAGAGPSMCSPRFYQCTEVAEGSVYAFGGFDGTRVLRSVERLDPVAGCWEYVPPMSRPRIFACSALLDGYIYVVGGCISGQVALNSAERYSPSMRAWQMLPNMQQSRAFAVAAPICKKQLLICGGYDAEVLVSVECFVPRVEGKSLGEWRTLPQMHYGGFLVAKAQDEFGHLYICGGGGDSEGGGGRIPCGGQPVRRSLRHAQRFHSVLQSWETLPPMLVERCGATAGAMGGGRIMVCGGFGYGSTERHRGHRDWEQSEPARLDWTSAECFDPALGAWSALAPMRTARSFFASTVTHGRLYVFGGTGCSKASRPVLRSGECYRFATDEWEDLPSMPVARTGAYLCAL